MNFKSLYNQYHQDGTRYQEPLAEFCKEHKLKLLVETGSGVSSLCLLKALDDMDDGQLYSIDPFPFCQFETEHPRYELIKKKSYEALADLFIETGPWDMFLHDSDHWIECQTMEYEIGYHCLRPGGWIFSDDYEWDGHYAWRDFLAKYELTPVVAGNIQGAQKTDTFIIDKHKIKNYVKKIWNEAKEKGREWREANNRPPCHSCEEGFSEYWKYPFQ